MTYLEWKTSNTGISMIMSFLNCSLCEYVFCLLFIQSLDCHVHTLIQCQSHPSPWYFFLRLLYTHQVLPRPIGLSLKDHFESYSAIFLMLYIVNLIPFHSNKTCLSYKIQFCSVSQYLTNQNTSAWHYCLIYAS